jgi:DNA-binding CsgD family transcriptional regulator
MDRAVHDVVDSIYEAALDDSKWHECLIDFGAIAGSPNSTDLSIESGGEFLFESSTCDAGIYRVYEEHYAMTIPDSFWSDEVPVRHIEKLENFWEEGAYEQSEYYNDFALPYDFPGSITTVIDRKASGTLRMCQCRTGMEGQFQASALRLVQRFLPHFGRAFEVRANLADLRQEADAKAETLDRLPFGVVFLDDRGRVREMNRGARTISIRRDGFSVGRGGRLLAASPALTNELTALVTRTCAYSIDRPLDAGGTINLPRPSGLRHYNILVCPLKSVRVDIGLSRWAAVLFVRDPDAEPTPPIELIQRVHGLSAREAEIVWALSRGDRHREIADRLEISIDTMRTYLRRAVDKTGVRRQSELVTLVMTGPVILNGWHDETES